MSETETEQEAGIVFQMIIQKKDDGSYHMVPVDEETAPENLDDVYAALRILARNIDAQYTAAVSQQLMVQTANQIREDHTGKRESGLIIPK